MTRTTARLVESCNTALRCSCGSQQFRIHMDCDDAADEVSSTVMNNVECQNCHALYQLAYSPADQPSRDDLARAFHEAIHWDSDWPNEPEPVREDYRRGIDAVLRRIKGSEA